MAARRGRGDIDSLPERSRAATAGVKALSSAFDELSSKGKLSADTFMRFAGAAGQVHPALGLVAAGIGLVVGHAERLKQLDIDAAMMQFAAGAKSASLEWDLFAARLAAGSGETGKLKGKLEELAKTELLITNTKKRLNDEIERLEGTLKQEGVTQQMVNLRMDDARRIAGDRLTQHTATKAALEDEIRSIRSSESAHRMNALVIRSLGIPALAEWVEKNKKARTAQDELNAALVNAQFVMQALNAQQDTARIAAYNAELERQGMLWKDYGQSVALAGATNALNAYYDALDKTVSLNAIFAGSFDRAMRNAAASTVRAVGQEAAVRAIFELADGFRYLGTPGMQGLAAFHFKSAAIFGSIALAAGPGAGLLSVMPSGGGGGGRGGNGGGGGVASAGKSGPTINVTVIGVPDWTTKRSIAEWVAEVGAESG